MATGDYLESIHTVASYELDSLGHVNNANFLNYLEKARCDYLLARDLNFNDFEIWGKFPVVTRATLDFIRPARAHDHLLIRGRISKHSAVRFTLQYEIFNRQTRQLVLRAETAHVFIDRNNRPTRIPGPFVEKFLT